jgi:hypothetical protein
MSRGAGALFGLGIAALLGAMCGNPAPPVAGPSAEQGNPQIVAVVVDDLHRPLRNAVVFVYKASVNPVSVDQEPLAGVLVATSPTDTNGSCAFSNLIPGTYSIRAMDADSTHSTIITNIPISVPKPRNPEYKDTLTLAAPGAVHGIVTRGGVMGNAQNQKLTDAFIQVKMGETDRFTVTGPEGSYRFAGIPAGTYTVYYYATDGFLSARRENIVVGPGIDKNVDTVVLKPVPRLLPPKGFTAVYDTAGNKVNLRWQSVTYDALWYYAVDRKCRTSSSFDTAFSTSDTTFSDTLGAIPAGTVLYYVVHSVDKAFNPSVNAGPVEITVTKKN